MSPDETATTVKVAVVQAGSVPFDTGACVEKAVRLIGEAAASSAVPAMNQGLCNGFLAAGLGWGLAANRRDVKGNLAEITAIVRQWIRQP